MPTRGDLVGRYVVLEPLGSGGMGVVVAAYDPDLDRKIALKLLRTPEGAAEDPVANRRLLREAQALAKLAHPNVVTVHDVGLHDGQVFLAMEFVEGVTLAVWLKERPDRRAILDVFASAGEGLVAAHTRGIVHRDFKPQNVMLAHDPHGTHARRVRVMDFGVAFTRDGASASLDPEDEPLASSASELRSRILVDETETEMFAGTPAYMAPEQFFRLPLTAATDQFSFCVALWEALYGVRPFTGDTVAQLSVAVTQGKLVEPPAGAGVPAWIRRVLERGLRIDAADRYPSLQELLDALRQDPSRGRQRIAMIGIAVLAVGGAFAARHIADARTVAACERDAEAIAQVWNVDATRALNDAMLATGVAYAGKTAELVLPRLDAYAGRWRAARVDLCAEAGPALAASSADRAKAIACVDEARVAFEAVVGMLARADKAAVANAATAVSRLPDVQRCTDKAELARRPALPPSDAERQEMLSRLQAFARAEALMSARREDEAREVLAGLFDEIDDGPLLPRLLLWEARLRDRPGSGDAEEQVRKAFMVALQMHDDMIAARSASVLALIVGVHGTRPSEAVAWDEIAASLQVRMGLDEASDLDVANRLNTRGLIDDARGRYAAAIDSHSRALAIRENALGPEHPDVAESVGNLGLAHFEHGDYPEAEVELTRALALFEAVYGPDHPSVATALTHLGVLRQRTQRLEEARAHYERALAIRERALGPSEILVGYALANLASTYEEVNDVDKALALQERTLAIFEHALGPDHPNVGSLLGNMAIVHKRAGRYEQAIATATRGHAIIVRTLGADHPDAARVLLNVGQTYLAMQQPTRALESLNHVLAVWESAYEPDSLDLAAVCTSIAEAYRTTGDRPRALAFTIRALAVRVRAVGLDHALTRQSLTTLQDL